MPKPSSTTPDDQPQPVPVGLLLPHTRTGRTHSPEVPDWHGLSPNHLAYLIRRYTDAGDVVLDLDAHPAALAATTYLHRIPAQLLTDPHGLRLWPSPSAGPNSGVPHPADRGVDLILAVLPRTTEGDSPDDPTTAMSTWRLLLRPGGFLIAGLTTTPPPPGRFSYRATVIAAARAAGLFYHQHIPALLVPLPEHEPRTTPQRPDEGDDRRRLLAGRHLPTFRDLVVFGTTATGEENAHA
ncbi:MULTISPECIES: hypothetical protein [unclassified Micromonospora]|uniref:hypothetical protein n=1 Tax=unclassified Micromonospora TaxID=2617518 RepID=UPI001C5F3456|nr:hypothetical protein [Micromonospora sp. RL09-050-HVF-A]MBW4705193.1 hypothetical protein [Micromonospora sp. RL09-050-HVF-A]